MARWLTYTIEPLIAASLMKALTSVLLFNQSTNIITRTLYVTAGVVVIPLIIVVLALVTRRPGPSAR